MISRLICLYVLWQMDIKYAKMLSRSLSNDTDKTRKNILLAIENHHRADALFAEMNAHESSAMSMSTADVIAEHTRGELEAALAMVLIGVSCKSAAPAGRPRRAAC